jgi:hypothetical protein
MALDKSFCANSGRIGENLSTAAEVSNRNSKVRHRCRRLSALHLLNRAARGATLSSATSRAAYSAVMERLI